MTNLKKTEANRKNGRKSKGPVTARGKVMASKNALRHGFLSKHLNVPESLRAEFDELRDGLRTELKANGVLQGFYFEEILACMWKLRLLLRMEMGQFAAIDSEATSNSQPRAKVLEQDTNKRDLKKKIDFLEDLKNAVRLYGSAALTGNYRQPIIEHFGQDFYDSLTKWDTAGVLATRILLMFAEKDKLYPSREEDQKPVKSGVPEVEQAIDREPDPPVTPLTPPVADVESIERADLICKLISERQYYLQRLYDLKDSDGMQRAEPLNARVDLQIRYASALKRDLWRAILQFNELKSPLT